LIKEKEKEAEIDNLIIGYETQIKDIKSKNQAQITELRAKLQIMEMEKEENEKQATIVMQ
jgi:hypothetical protein